MKPIAGASCFIPAKTEKKRNLTDDFDRSVESYAFAPDSKTIYFTAEDKAEMPIYSIAAAPGSIPENSRERKFQRRI